MTCNLCVAKIEELELPVSYGQELAFDLTDLNGKINEQKNTEFQLVKDTIMNSKDYHAKIAAMIKIESFIPNIINQKMTLQKLAHKIALSKAPDDYLWRNTSFFQKKEQHDVFPAVRHPHNYYQPTNNASDWEWADQLMVKSLTERKSDYPTDFFRVAYCKANAYWRENIWLPWFESLEPKKRSKILFQMLSDDYGSGGQTVMRMLELAPQAFDFQDSQKIIWLLDRFYESDYSFSQTYQVHDALKLNLYNVANSDKITTKVLEVLNGIFNDQIDEQKIPLEDYYGFFNWLKGQGKAVSIPWENNFFQKIGQQIGLSAAELNACPQDNQIFWRALAKSNRSLLGKIILKGKFLAR